MFSRAIGRLGTTSIKANVAVKVLGVKIVTEEELGKVDSTLGSGKVHKVSVGIEKANRSSYTRAREVKGDGTVEGIDEDLLELKVTLYQDSLGNFQKKRCFVLLKTESSWHMHDALNFTILATGELHLDEICPKCDAEPLEMSLPLTMKRGGRSRVKSVTCLLAVHTDFLETSDSASQFSDFSSVSMGIGTSSRAGAGMSSQDLLDKLNVVHLELDKEKADNASLQEALADLQRKFRSNERGQELESSPRSTSSDGSTGTVRLEVLTIENRQLKLTVERLRKELREVQNTLVVRDKGQVLNRDQKAMISHLQRELANEAMEFPSPVPTQAYKGTGSSAGNSDDLAYFIPAETRTPMTGQPRRDELAALAIHVEQLEEENLALREREKLHMLKAVTIREEGPQRKAALHAAKEARSAQTRAGRVAMVDEAVSVDFIKNTDENTLIDLAALEMQNDMNDLQQKLEISRAAMDEERQKVFALKQVLHQMGSLSPQHKQTLLTSGIILTDGPGDFLQKGDEDGGREGTMSQFMRRLSIAQN